MIVSVSGRSPSSRICRSTVGHSRPRCGCRPPGGCDPATRGTRRGDLR
jgi:hypothetical protein